MFFHETDGRMIPYLGPDFVRALLGLDACDGSREEPLSLDSGESLVTPAKLKAQNEDWRYAAQQISPNCDQESPLPESKGEIGSPAAEKVPLSEWVQGKIDACCLSDSDNLVITAGDETNRETLTTSHRVRSVASSLWDRLALWLNKHTGARER